MKLAVSILCLVLALIVQTYANCPAVNEYNAQWKVTSPNQVLTGTCNGGYVGTPQRTCLANSTWGNPTKLCYPFNNTCPAQSYGNAVWGATLVGLTANGTCNLGYSGKPTRKCNFDSTWSTSLNPTCAQIRCAAKTEGNSTWPGATAGATVVGTCVAGYGGRETRLCQYDGTLGPINGTCLRCNGEVYSTATYPATASLTYGYGVCQSGYTGTPKRFCTQDGVYQTYIWNPCQVIKCAPITDNNAYWPITDQTGYSSGTCQAGYMGAPSRQCILNGTSAYFGPIQNPCYNASTVCPGQTYGNSIFSDTVPGTTATGTCLPGYSGTPSLNCMFNTGVWSTNIMNPCQRIYCSQETIGNVRFDPTPAGSADVGVCLNGTSGHVQRSCDINGVWQTPSGTCS